jgi:hypothetical protein
VSRAVQSSHVPEISREELIGEIHHIAFEERLGRVRTNLLLVRAELQATASLCEGQDMTQSAVASPWSRLSAGVADLNPYPEVWLRVAVLRDGGSDFLARVGFSPLPFGF